MVPEEADQIFSHPAARSSCCGLPSVLTARNSKGALVERAGIQPSSRCHYCFLFFVLLDKLVHTLCCCLTTVPAATLALHFVWGNQHGLQTVQL